MSGVPIARAKLLAYALAGFLSSVAGLMLTFLTYSAQAKAVIGADYTLNSIAAVVIGGTSLFGGVGSAIGSIFGAFVLKTVGDLLIVFDINPVLQPLFVGVVLLLRGDASVRCGCCASRTSSISTGRERMSGDLILGRFDRATVIAFACSILLIAARRDRQARLPFLRLHRPAAADRVVPRHHRDRHDAGHPARTHRPLRAVDGLRRRHDGDRRAGLARPLSSARARARPRDPLRHPLRHGRSAS